MGMDPNAWFKRFIPSPSGGALYWLVVDAFPASLSRVKVSFAYEDGDDVAMPNVANMYDLRELVRLLGGAK